MNPLEQGAKENNLLEIPQRNRIYIASFFDTRQRLRVVRDSLWQMGYEVTSTWLDETAKSEGMSMTEFFKKLAIKDMTEIVKADILILDTFDITPRGGREVEYGIALGQFHSKLVYIVGPKRNVFHELCDKQFEKWEDCLEHLKPRNKE